MAASITLPSLPATFIQEEREPWSEDQFFAWCQCNGDLRVERHGFQEIVLMSPSGSRTSGINFILLGQLATWTRLDGTGIGFESNGGFRLPDGSMLAPDAAWLRKERWEALTLEDQGRFAPVCPDFVIEVRSPSDRLAPAREKMTTWLQNGAQLAWLIDPEAKTVEVYRPEREPELLAQPAEVHGEGPVTGFLLELASVWG